MLRKRLSALLALMLGAMATTKSTGRGSQVDWFCPGQGFDNTPASLAAAAQLTAMDQQIKNPVTAQAYASGAVVGLRLWVSLDPNAILDYAPYWVVMVLPNGLAVPAVGSWSNRKSNERYIWAHGLMTATVRNGGTTERWDVKVDLTKTARKFDSGDRLVLTVGNPGSVAFGAQAKAEYVVDAYVNEA